jgi:hypothetical protein
MKCRKLPRNPHPVGGFLTGDWAPRARDEVVETTAYGLVQGGNGGDVGYLHCPDVNPVSTS